jgi:hypothetical protein
MAYSTGIIGLVVCKIKLAPLLADSYEKRIFCQRGPTGGLQATSGRRPFVTRSDNLFINLLLVTRRSSIFLTRKDFKTNRDSYLICCLTYNCHTRN